MAEILQVRVIKLKSDTKKGRKRISDERMQKLVGLVSGQVEPNFELPFMGWPEGDRELSDRALILMLAGLELLEVRYPKKAADHKPADVPADKHLPPGSPKISEDWL